MLKSRTKILCLQFSAPVRAEAYREGIVDALLSKLKPIETRDSQHFGTMLTANISIFF